MSELLKLRENYLYFSDTFHLDQSDIATRNIFIFCSHYYRSKAIHRARQGGARACARAVDHLTWRALV